MNGDSRKSKISSLALLALARMILELLFLVCATIVFISFVVIALSMIEQIGSSHLHIDLGEPWLIITCWVLVLPLFLLRNWLDARFAKSKK